MNKKSCLMALWIGVLLLGFTSPAQAGGISQVSPAEGTVGTQLTLSGSGFGQKHGEVLIGAVKCKILDWSDSEITCLVDKPQHSGEYTVTVLSQGDKKPAEPMTYDSFTMRRPQIIPADTPTGLLWDGEAVTIQGAFFGDKPGEVLLVHREDELQIERMKVLDWSMDSIRFELPPQLAEKYVLVVRNEVGMDYRLIVLSPGGPPQLENPPPGFIGDPARNNSSGITYNGKFYIFSVHIRCVFCNDSKRIQAFTYASGQLSAKLPIAEGITDAQIVPVVIEDKLWVFHTGIHGDLYFTRTNGTSWESTWTKIPNVATNSNWEIAPVYNPVLKRIEVYHEYQSYLNWVYSYDYGQTWTSGGKVAGLTEDAYKMSGAPGALFFQGSNGVDYTVLAYKSAGSGGLTVYAIGSDGSRVKVDYPIGIDARPFLMDYDASYFLVIYSQSNSWMIVQKFYKSNFQRTATADIPLDTAWATCWCPNAALNRVDGKFYLFWGYDERPGFGGYDPSPTWIMTHITIY